MQAGCRELIKQIAGEDKANELKKMRESGASKADLKAKVIEFMDAITDEDKKQKAVRYAPACQRIFELDDSRVKRSDIDSAKFDEAMKGHLSWLSEDQKTEIKGMKESGKSFEDVQKKVFEFYEALSGDAKKKATDLMQQGCRDLIKELVGEEKANELKKMRESNASKADIKAKIVAYMDELTDEKKKEQAVKYAPSCQKIFEIGTGMS